MRGFQLYIKYIRLNFLAGLEYKGWSIMVLQVFIAVVTDPLGVLFMFSRFGNIGAWSMERILLIYAMAVTSYGLAESFFRGFDYFPTRMIASGDFDKILLRPRSLIVQIAGSYFHLHRLTRAFGGLFAIIWSLSRQGVPMDMGKVVVLCLALVGGFLVYCGVFVFTSGLTFFTIKGLNWIYIFTNSYGITQCPMEYMPRALRYLFTFFMPMLVISYYPASYVCGWGEPLFKALLALPAGLAFLAFSFLIWRIGVRHYQSTGS